MGMLTQMLTAKSNGQENRQAIDNDNVMIISKSTYAAHDQPRQKHNGMAMTVLNRDETSKLEWLTWEGGGSGRGRSTPWRRTRRG
jgi:hypothetical protein